LLWIRREIGRLRTHGKDAESALRRRKALRAGGRITADSADKWVAGRWRLSDAALAA